MKFVKFLKVVISFACISLKPDEVVYCQLLPYDVQITRSTHKYGDSSYDIKLPFIGELTVEKDGVVIGFHTIQTRYYQHEISNRISRSSFKGIRRILYPTLLRMCREVVEELDKLIQPGECSYFSLTENKIVYTWFYGRCRND